MRILHGPHVWTRGLGARVLLAVRGKRVGPWVPGFPASSHHERVSRERPRGGTWPGTTSLPDAGLNAGDNGGPRGTRVGCRQTHGAAQRPVPHAVLSDGCVTSTRTHHAPHRVMPHGPRTTCVVTAGARVPRGPRADGGGPSVSVLAAGSQCGDEKVPPCAPGQHPSGSPRGTPKKERAPRHAHPAPLAHLTPSCSLPPPTPSTLPTAAVAFPPETAVVEDVLLFGWPPCPPQGAPGPHDPPQPPPQPWSRLRSGSPAPATLISDRLREPWAGPGTMVPE